MKFLKILSNSADNNFVEAKFKVCKNILNKC